MKAGNRRPESNEWSEKQPSSIVTEKIDPAAGFGHKTITMSARYSHLSPEHRLSVIDRIATVS